MPEETVSGAEGMRIARCLTALVLAVGDVLEAEHGRYVVTPQLASAAAALSGRLADLP